jgi:hypothetical protein
MSKKKENIDHKNTSLLIIPDLGTSKYFIIG